MLSPVSADIQEFRLLNKTYQSEKYYIQIEPPAQMVFRHSIARDNTFVPYGVFTPEQDDKTRQDKC